MPGRAFDMLGDNMLNFHDNGPHVMTRDAFQDGIGDVVLARKGMGTSYHLSVVVDDAAQGVTLVTRGQDLFASTWIHVLLQRLLDLETPEYRHHRLIRDDAGKRLAKRDDARSLRELRGRVQAPPISVAWSGCNGPERGAQPRRASGRPPHGRPLLRRSASNECSAGWHHKLHREAVAAAARGQPLAL